MANTPNLDLKKMEGNPKEVNFNHKEFYEDNFVKVDAAVGAKPADLTTTAKTIIPAINELKLDKVDKVTGKGLSTNDFDNTYKQKIDTDIPAQLAEKALKTDVGLLSGLLTTVKTSIVNAINEIFNNKANKAQEAWITPTLLNGWVGNYVELYGNLRYRKNQFGNVEIVGSISGGANNSIVFVLPAGYRPSHYKAVVTKSGGTSLASFEIETNGNVKILNFTTNVQFDFSFPVN